MAGEPSPVDLRPRLKAVLVIGVHREELAFGEKAAAGLDPSLIDVLRIPEGISGRRPRQDELFYYTTRHRELYHQLLRQIRGRYRLVLDLHCGVDETGRCADLISSDSSLFGCVAASAAARYGEGEGTGVIRSVLLEPEPRADSPTETTPARTVIPPDVWNNSAFRYVGIEIYLSHRDSGQAEDCEFARWMIRKVMACHACASPEGSHH